MTTPRFKPGEHVRYTGYTYNIICRGEDGLIPPNSPTCRDVNGIWHQLVTVGPDECRISIMIPVDDLEPILTREQLEERVKHLTGTLLAVRSISSSDTPVVGDRHRITQIIDEALK